MEKEEYPVKVDDEIYGPIPIDRIINDVKNGELSKDATFLDNGDWIPVTLLLEENIPITPWNEDNWVDITRRETMEGAEAAIEGSVEHFSKKLEYIKGPKVVKTFK